MNNFAVLADQRTAARRSWWRRLFAAGAVIAAVMAVSAGALADCSTDDQLYADCSEVVRTWKGDFRTGYCAGYIAAIADLMNREGILGHKICRRGTVNLAEMIDIVVRYAAAQPDLLGNFVDAPFLVGLTCPTAPPPGR